MQRFTAVHEIRQYILHPRIGDHTLHREIPPDGLRTNRPLIDRESDCFDAFLLMQRKAVVAEFSPRLGSKHPLVLTDTVAIHLKADEPELFAQPSGPLMFAEAVAKAQQFDRVRFRSLASFFGVSPERWRSVCKSWNCSLRMFMVNEPAIRHPGLLIWAMRRHGARPPSPP